MEYNGVKIKNTKMRMSTASKVLLGIIICTIVIIILLIILLMNAKKTDFRIYSDGVDITKKIGDKFSTTIDGVIYFNIEEFSKIVGYEYHRGEYKASVIDENKCYVEGKEETASFYLNTNVIYKLLVNEQNKPYTEFEVQNTIKRINGRIYASTEAISKAFNVLIDCGDKYFKIYTLEYLVTLYDANVKKWGYTGIANQNFENKKALLCGKGYLIVKKRDGLYKIIDSNNTKEITLDRYKSIQFSENTQEFFVTDALGKVGTIDLEGFAKIQPFYDSIELLSKEDNLYIVKENDKYGVVFKNSMTVIYPEYDRIGLKDSWLGGDKYLILNELIPVYKDGKYGAFNKKGEMVLDTIYDDFGYPSKKY